MRKTFLKVSFWSLMALGMATSFTACKDYDDDIDQLRKEVAQNADAIKQINSLISSGSVITDVTSNANGIVIKLSNGKEYPITNGTNGKDGVDGVNGTVWTIGDDGYWYKDGVKTDYKALGEDGKPGQDATGEAGAAGEAGIYYRPNTETGCFEICNPDGTVKEQTTIPYTGAGVTAVDDGDFIILSNVKDADGKFTTVTISKTGALRSLVFVPDGYLEGVEATKYNFANVNSAWAIPSSITKAQTVTIGAVKYTIPVNGYYAATELKNKAYTILSEAQVTYQLNPENANIKGAEWAFITMDAEKISRPASRAADDNITVVGQPTKNDDGDLVVTYQLSDSYLYDEDGELALNQDESTYNMMALTATIGEGEVITSDYAMIVPVENTFAALAFAKQTGTTNLNDNDLYTSATQALSLQAYSYSVAFNSGETDLSKIITVHFNELNAGKHPVVLSLADACAKYKLTPNFELVAYTAGANGTSEDHFAQLDATGKFAPCYVNAAGEKVLVGTGEDANQSSIGKRPMVLVTLKDADGTIVLAGYFVINIASKAAVANTFVVNEVELPWLCNNNAASTWQQISGIVLSQLNISEANFRELYSNDGQVYVKVGDKYVTKGTNNGWPTYKQGNNTIAYDFGSLTWESRDQTTAGQTTPALKWAGNQNAAAAIYAQPDHQITLYTGFYVQGSADKLYIGITLSILDKPEVTFGVKNADYWFNNNTQTRLNTFAPNNNTATPVTDFTRDLNNAFRGSKAVLSTTTAGYKFSGDGAVATNVIFSFKVGDQPVLTSGNTTYTLTVHNKNYGVAGAQPNYDTTKIDCIKKVGTAAAQAPVTIIELDQDGVIEYLANDLAKEVLNLYASNDAENMTYANVMMSGSYDCGIALPGQTETFQARFLRPLNAVEGPGAKFQDAAVGGSSVAIGLLFNMKDWQNNQLIKYTAATASAAAKFEANKINNIDIFDYYKVTKVVVNLDPAAVKTDMGGVNSTLQAANKNLELKVNGATSYTWTGTMADLLSTTVTYYNNGNAVSNDFNLYIPVTVTYAWGTTAPCYVKVPVAKTPNQAD